MTQHQPRDYEAEAQDVPQRRYAYDFDTVLRRYMMQCFAPLLPTGKALELGCYKGEFTALLAAQYPDLTVVEGAHSLLEETQKRVGRPLKCLHATFEAVELPPASFDAVFLIHTLEHLDDPVAVLRKIRGWLSPAGRLFVAVPNANAPSRQIAVKMGLISHNSAITEAEAKHGHRCTYALDTLERDAVAAGLHIVRRGGVFFKPFANFQFDNLIGSGVIDQAYLDGCYALGMDYPDLCASVYLVCSA